MGFVGNVGATPNCILGIKEGKKNGDVSKWINVNADDFIKPLIEEILNPKIIITLGLPAFKSFI